MSNSQQPWSDARDAMDSLRAFAKEHNIDMGEVAVGGSVALAYQGIDQEREINDINIWVEGKVFARLGEDTNTILHPLVDTVIKFPEQRIYIRKWVKWFEVDPHEQTNFFKPLSLLTFKRGSYSNPLRPLAKRVQDKKDIVRLTDFLANKNKVRDDAA